MVGFLQSARLSGIADAGGLRQATVLSVMFVMSLTLALDEVAGALRRPAAALLAVAVNVGVLPLFAWLCSLPLAKVSIEMATGLLVAAAVPCTLASAAVWTRRAGGNDAVALMVTVITNLGCFLITPFWLLTTTGQEVEISFGNMALKLLLLVVLPIVAAQLLRLHRPVGEWATRRKTPLGVAAQCGVLSIVGIGAIKIGLQMEADPWRLIGWDKAIMIAGVMTVHLAMLAAGMGLAAALHQRRDDRIAVGIAGSQKTLLVGLEISQAYFAFAPAVMLPMVVYHVGQLLADTFIADWLRRRGEARESAARAE